MYRPKGWKTIPLWSRIYNGRPITSSHKAFEAGADAMLEALCTDENRMDCIDQHGMDPPKNVKGWLVFIPE